MTAFRAKPKTIASGGMALAMALLSLTACGTSGGDSTSSADPGSCKLPAEIGVAHVQDLTGSAGFAGVLINKGIDLAVEQVNASDLLKGSKIVVEKLDSASDPATASSQVTKAIADKKNLAVFGPALSLSAAATAPIAERSNMPIVFAQAGSDGVVTGDYTFRITPPAEVYYPKIESYLKAKGSTKLSLIYASESPTFKKQAEKVFPKMIDDLGIESGGQTAVSFTTQGFNAPISKALKSDPDVVALLLSGAQNGTAVTQLRQAGYTGTIIATSSAGAGSLKTAGDAAVGVTWPSTWHADLDNADNKAFVSAFTTKYGEAPLNYSAEGFDGMNWLAQAIAMSCGTRDGVKDGLAKLAKEGFDGTVGTYTFDGNDARLKGVNIQWDGTGEKLLQD